MSITVAGGRWSRKSITIRATCTIGDLEDLAEIFNTCTMLESVDGSPPAVAKLSVRHVDTSIRLREDKNGSSRPSRS